MRALPKEPGTIYDYGQMRMVRRRRMVGLRRSSRQAVVWHFISC